MAEVILKDVCKMYDGGVLAVKHVDLEIRNREFMVLVGPSGCGKSTTLRMIAGLEEISSGTVTIGNRVVNDVPPKDRDIAMVFQNYALYPHMTVYDNLAFGLKLRKLPKADIDKRVNEAAEILGIHDYLQRRPKALSGGQRQRVAVGRAIVRKPEVFLFDEPLSNLDAKMRVQMRTEISKLHTRLETTMIYVTHDQIEAMTMGDRICVMKDGIIQQVDTPLHIYDTPANIFVAGFIGTPQMNFVDCTLVGEGGDVFVQWGNNKLKLPADKANNPALKDYIGKEVIAGIRPEAIHDEPMFLASLADTVIDANVDVTELMGAEIYLYLTSEEESLTARVSSRSTARAGDSVKVAVDMSRVHIFDKDTEKCIIH